MVFTCLSLDPCPKEEKDSLFLRRGEVFCFVVVVGREEIVEKCKKALIRKKKASTCPVEKRKGFPREKKKEKTFHILFYTWGNAMWILWKNR